MEIRKQTVLRLDEKLYDQFAKLAKEEDRSVNALMIQLIKKYIKENS